MGVVLQTQKPMEVMQQRKKVCGKGGENEEVWVVGRGLLASVWLGEAGLLLRRLGHTGAQCPLRDFEPVEEEAMLGVNEEEEGLRRKNAGR